MNVLSVESVAPSEYEMENAIEPLARIRVDGRDLIAILRDIELAFATAEGNPSIAGAYVPIRVSEVCAPSRRLLGGHFDPFEDSVTHRAILSCQCGEPGCWPFLARIELTDDQTSWSAFAQPHRPMWKYDALGTFTFDREQYEHALGF